MSKEDLHRPRIGIDLLGCQTSGGELLEAISSAKFEGTHPPLFTVFGTKDIFQGVSPPKNFHCHIVTETIFPEDDPLTAVRRKKDSSIIVGLEELKKFEIDAFISAGNSGALLAASKFKLPMLKGIDRPGFLTLIPSKQDPIAVIDVGANVDLKAENLLQFAQMGIAYQKTRGLKNPIVGLLNIGEEKKKGTSEHRKAYKLLQELNLHSPNDSPAFIGNIEGRDVFRGGIDVLVTDGFTGNIFLKTSEGIASFILEHLQNLGPIESLPGLKTIINNLRSRLHFAEFPGAILCGVEGIIIKCHGASPPEAFINSITGASRLVKNFFLKKIQDQL